MSTLLQLAISAWIVVVLVRSARNAWARRDLIRLIWSGVDLRVAGQALGLLVATMAAIAVLLLVPGLDHGLGDVVGFSGNAVFTPLDQAAGALGPAPSQGPDWALVALATGFLGFLLALLPWLAFVEEEVFRAGLEVEGLRGQVLWALRFGLAHLVMLVPLAAALAIAVAGFGYGRVYRRRHAEVSPADAPLVAVAAFRPTRRSRLAALRQRHVVPEGAVVATAELTIERRQAAAVLASTRVHMLFNTVVVGLVWLAIVLPALDR